jgi:hypothetical protein
MTISLSAFDPDNLEFQFQPLPTNRRQCENFCSAAIRGFCWDCVVRRAIRSARELIRMTEAALNAHRKYIVENLEDMPAIRNWKWTPD